MPQMEINAPSPSLYVDELHIRSITPEDIDSIVKYFIKNKKHLVPWEPERLPVFYSQLGWEHRLKQIMALQKHKMSYYLIIVRKQEESAEQQDEILGVITYSNILYFPMHSCHLGYSLSESEQGKGIMRRALKATNQWMFDELNIHRIMASYIPRNNRSASVLASLNFVKEGEAKDYLLINGRWEDHILTSLVNENWKPADRRYKSL